MGKTTSDRLNDVLLKIPECLDLRQSLKEMCPNGSPLLQTTRDALEGKSRWLLACLHDYWKEYGNEIDSNYDWGQYHELSNYQTSAEAWNITAPRPVQFRNRIAATIIPEYDAGIVILNSTLREACMDSVEEHKQRIAVHCASILESAAFLEKLGMDSGGNTCMVFPLKTVYLCTPSQQQIAQSGIELAKWGKTRGLEGVCNIWRDTF